MSCDKRPPEITIWACPRCGYWRRERSTGVHAHFDGNGPAETHPVVATKYRLAEGE